MTDTTYCPDGDACEWTCTHHDHRPNQRTLFPTDDDTYYECIDRLYDEANQPIMRRVETPGLIEGVL